MAHSNAQIQRIIQEKNKELSSGLKIICQGCTIKAVNPVNSEAWGGREYITKIAIAIDLLFYSVSGHPLDKVTLVH